MKSVKPVKSRQVQRGESSNGVVRLVVMWTVLLGLGGLIGYAFAAGYSQTARTPSVSNQSSQGGQSTPKPGVVGRVLMVSGRDDHGLVQDPVVPLYKAPDDDTVVARVPDGTFVRVVDQRHEWIRVQMITNTQATGWVNDYYLRNRMIRTDGGGQVDLLDARELGGKIQLYVRAVTDPAATPVWLDATELQEIGARLDK
ncbi:MAG TPA: SH3 domain-containing protein [Chloroflexia bacterium]|nr:SH3 domain-containing protein [Chloroflexia bacterium]